MLRSTRSKVIASAAVLLGINGLLSWLTAVPAANQPQQSEPAEFTADGKLKRPYGYRQWIFVGCPLTPNDLNGGEATFPEFHDVYIDPESFAHFQKTGHFRDGTVIVKELTSVGSKQAPSGNGYFQGDFTGLETAIKDAKRFKDEPGNWGYFSFGHKYPLKKEVAANATASCNACHQANAKTDWVFTQYYPVLRAAMPGAK
jgi:hypothetical protein